MSAWIFLALVFLAGALAGPRLRGLIGRAS